MLYTIVTQLAYFQELDINVIKVYFVNPDADHNAFMCALEPAEINIIPALAHNYPICAATQTQYQIITLSS